MGKPKRRFVARAEAGRGWRIWDTLQKRWWGKPYPYQPIELIDELNGQKRPEAIVKLSKLKKP